MHMKHFILISIIIAVIILWLGFVYYLFADFVYAPNEKEIKYIDDQIKFRKELKEAEQIELNYEIESRKELKEKETEEFFDEKMEYNKGK